MAIQCRYATRSLSNTLAEINRNYLDADDDDSILSDIAWLRLSVSPFCFINYIGMYNMHVQLEKLITKI